MFTPRSPAGEARRLAALRSPEARARMSAAHKGRTPANFAQAREQAWAANRKDALTYSGIHAWVRRTWGPAAQCEVCGKRNLSGQSAHWANLSHTYSRERADWMMMCRPCHAAHDAANNGTTFANSRSLVTHCPRGHEYSPENTHIYNNNRSCRTCRRERARQRRDAQRGSA